MIKLTKSYDNFKELIDSINEDLASQLPAIQAGIDECSNAKEYNKFVCGCAYWIQENIPSFTNPSYPDCVSMTATTYGISIFKKEMIFAITTFLDKKTGDVSYVVTITIKKNKSFLVHNSIYNYYIEDGYEEEEIEDRPKAKKK